MDTTLDGLLNRRVALEQPKQGFRVAIDTVLLAAAVPAKAGETVADFGCGVGGAMLCLACRVPGITVTGFEIQLELAELARANIGRNSFDAALSIVTADITKTVSQSFDHIMMNPPYHNEARHDVSANDVKRMANTEKNGDLALWIASAAASLKTEGMLTLIHRADRVDEILEILKPHFPAIDVLPIMPKPDAPMKRVIIRASKNGATGIRQSQNLILHNPDGSYTAEANVVLRDAKPLS